MEKKMFERRCPAVYAGLLATVGLAASLSVTPVIAHADEVAAPANQQGTVLTVEDGHVGELGFGQTGEQETPGSTTTVEEGDKGGDVVPTLPGNENTTPDSTVTDSTETPGSEVPGEEVSGSETTETPGEEGSEADGAEVETPGEEGTEADPTESESEDETLDVEGSEADGTDAETPGVEGAESDALTQTVTKAPSLSSSVAATAEPQGGEAAEKEPLPATGWVVEDRGDGLQRYYVSGGETLKGLFEAVIDGVSSWFYGREDLGGAVVRGKWDNGRGRVYLADNDGRLAEVAGGSGWLVTDAYDGELQRYYIDGAAHAAVSGYFSTDAYGRLGSEGALDRDHFGLGGEGYVLRGAGSGVRSDRILADNDGRLAEGWVVTDVFGQGLQRYWFDSAGRMAKERLVGATEGDASGWYAYALSDGRILRGKYDNGRGRVYLADNDGRLASGRGWLVTGLYDGGVLQRYYIDEAAHAAISGFFKFEGSQYFGIGGKGYVLRGATPWGSVMLIADNDGKMVGSAGTGVTAKAGSTSYKGNWLVTGGYFNSSALQRYFITAVPGQSGFFGALIGEFSIGDDEYYGRNDTGYVVRGYYSAPNGRVYYGDNDGKLDQYGFLSEVGRRLWDQIMWKSSKTQYLIAVDRINCHTVVFRGRAGAWVPIFDWLCTTGNPVYNGGDGTLKGDWQIGGPDWAYADHTWSPGDPFPTNRDNYRVENWVKSGAKYFTGFFYNLGFHSTVINYSDESQLGHRISHGCVRLLEKNAKWIYENAGIGTTVSVI